MCRLLSVSRSGFYAWQDRPMSARARRDAELMALIHQIHERSYQGTYGAPRIHRELRLTYGIGIGRKRVERLMRRAGLQGVQKRRFRCTTRSGAPERFVPDLVQRHFVADRPNALWLADVTLVSTAEGRLYVAAVLDVFSRLVVGWAMDERLGSQLVLSALQMAYAQREPRKVIHHSDHGTEYTAVAFGKRCGQLGITLSMGSVGDCYDNAMMESFFSSLEAEVLDRNRFRTREEARRAIFCWLAGWYNTRRRHSGVDYLSPQEFESRFATRRRPSAASASGSPVAKPTKIQQLEKRR
jgi:transposase InsO family protein